MVNAEMLPLSVYCQAQHSDEFLLVSPLADYFQEMHLLQNYNLFKIYISIGISF